MTGSSGSVRLEPAINLVSRWDQLMGTWWWMWLCAGSWLEPRILRVGWWRRGHLLFLRDCCCSCWRLSIFDKLMKTRGIVRLWFELICIGGVLSSARVWTINILYIDTRLLSAPALWSTFHALLLLVGARLATRLSSRGVGVQTLLGNHLGLLGRHGLVGARWTRRTACCCRGLFIFFNFWMPGDKSTWLRRTIGIWLIYRVRRYRLADIRRSTNTIVLRDSSLFLLFNWVFECGRDIATISLTCHIWWRCRWTSCNCWCMRRLPRLSGRLCGYTSRSHEWRKLVILLMLQSLTTLLHSPREVPAWAEIMANWLVGICCQTGISLVSCTSWEVCKEHSVLIRRCTIATGTSNRIVSTAYIVRNWCLLLVIVVLLSTAITRVAGISWFESTRTIWILVIRWWTWINGSWSRGLFCQRFMMLRNRL